MKSKIVVALLSAGLIGSQALPAYSVSKALMQAARAACKKQYGKNPTSVEISKDLKNIKCVFGSAKSASSMTRNEVYNYCKKKYQASAIIVSRTKTGWLCRYYSLYQ